jgi:peptidoglycan/xylan/chitin deacetylase (PgdA/CDA1 family)
MLHDAPMQRASDITYSVIHQYLDMPVFHLGLVPQHLQVDQDALPEYPLAGRIAGIVTHFDSDQPRPALAAFLQRAIAEGIKVVSLGHPGVGDGPALAETFGLQTHPATPRAPVRISAQRSEIGFELTPLPTLAGFRPLAAPPGSEPLLTLRDARGSTMDAVAYTPWGAYALWGQALARLPSRPDEVRWVIDPIAFLRQALALPAMPVPDTTTESGRRLLLAHVDGDGFANASDQPGSPMSSAVLLRDIFERYRIPTTMSVIEGETSPQGLYPQYAAELEAIARRMFALPHIEIGSHSYSHPFNWEKAADGANDARLQLPGYVFDIEREVAGSIRYIEERLAPAGKKVRLYQWSGNTNPGEAALAAVERAGIGAINGGETLITRAQPSITKVAPPGVRKGSHFQVYAPNQNENVYTNHYTGPLYGYERVIETFELTERPRRLKPINLYFHTYAASRRASLEALHKAWRWAMAQPTYPLHTSAYVEKVSDFEHIVIARGADGFLVRGAQALRQLRAPAALGVPQIAASRSLAGYTDTDGVGERYLHLGADEAWLRFGSQGDGAPRLVDANARIEAFQHANGRTRLRLAAQVPLQFSLAHGQACTVDADKQRLTVTATPAGLYRYALDSHGSATITIACP